MAYTAIAMLILVFAVRPLIQKIEAKSEEVQKKIIDDEINLAKVAKLPEARSTSESFNQKKQNLDVIIDSDREVDFIEKMEALAEETDNKIELKITESYTDEQVSKNSQSGKDKKEPDDIKSKLPYNKYLVIQVNLTGNYGNLVNFVYKLENFDYYVNLISLSLNKGTQESEPGTSGDIFAPRSPSGASNNGEKNSSAEKGILKSTLEVVAYIK